MIDLYGCEVRVPLHPVGSCIYCLSTVYDLHEPARPLGGEHIIPKSLGGRMVLPLASCKRCEAVTSGIEARVTASLLRNNRHELGLKAGEAQDADQKTAMLLMYKYEPPEAISGRPANDQINVVGAPLYPDFAQRLAANGPHEFSFPRGFADFEFRQLLAKVAHSYAVAAVGAEGFRPLLLNAISGQQPFDDLSFLVGGQGSSTPPPQRTDTL